jgi:hypothetical protein
MSQLSIAPARLQREEPRGFRSTGIEALRQPRRGGVCTCRPSHAVRVAVDRAFDDDRLRRFDQRAERFVGQFGRHPRKRSYADIEAARRRHRKRLDAGAAIAAEERERHLGGVWFGFASSRNGREVAAGRPSARNQVVASTVVPAEPQRPQRIVARSMTVRVAVSITETVSSILFTTYTGARRPRAGLWKELVKHGGCSNRSFTEATHAVAPTSVSSTFDGARRVPADRCQRTAVRPARARRMA